MLFTTLLLGRDEHPGGAMNPFFISQCLLALCKTIPRYYFMSQARHSSLVNTYFNTKCRYMKIVNIVIGIGHKALGCVGIGQIISKILRYSPKYYKILAEYLPNNILMKIACHPSFWTILNHVLIPALCHFYSYL